MIQHKPLHGRAVRAARVVLAFVVAAAGLLMAGAASPAAAAPAASLVPSSIQYVTNNIYGASFTHIGPAAVSCPAGTRMVSGGAGHAFIGAIAPYANFTAVAADGLPIAGTNPDFLQITVGCAPASLLPNLTSRIIGVPVPSAGVPRGVVYCPAGMRAFGGGGYFRTPQGRYRAGGVMFSNTVSADGTGWTVSGSAGAGDLLILFTQCASLNGYVATNSVPLTPGGVGQVYATCAPGYTALSGGVYLSRSDGTEHPGNIMWSIPASVGGSSSWYVSAGSDGYPDTKLVALAQCISPS